MATMEDRRSKNTKIEITSIPDMKLDQRRRFVSQSACSMLEYAWP